MPDGRLVLYWQASAIWCHTPDVYLVVVKTSKQELYVFCVRSEGGASREDSRKTIFMDIHFADAAIVRYRTDISYSWLDLLGER
jgi:hypothetical protein